MADETPAPFKTQAELQEFVAKAKAAMTEIVDLRERTVKAETLAAQLKAGMDAMSAQRVADGEHIPEGTDGELVRSTYRRSLSQDDAQALGGVCDLRNEHSRERGFDEARRYVGGANGVVRMLGGVEHGSWEDGLLDDPAPKTQWHHDLQRKVEEAGVIKAVLGRVSAKRLSGIVEHLKRGPKQIAKVFADNTGEGGEWIITLPTTELQRTAELARQLESTIMDMPVSATVTTLPFLTSGAQPYLHNVPASGDMNPAVLPKSIPTTADRTLTIKTLTVNVPVDMDAAEESIVDALPLMSLLVSEALRDGTEDGMLNGDTAATHGDTAFATWNPRSRWSSVSGSANDHRRGWIGWRQRAFDVSATADFNASQTVSAYIGALSGLTVPHAFSDVMYVTSPEHYLAKILIDTNVLTVDKYGPSATILSGEVARIGGRPLILSEFMVADMAASGLYTGAGALTGMVIVNRARFKMARRRGVRLNLESVYRDHTHYVVASERKAMVQFDSATTKNVRYLYNLSSS